MAKNYLKRFLSLLLAMLDYAYRFTHDFLLSLARQYSANGRAEQGLFAQQTSWRYAAIVTLHGDSSITPFAANLMRGLAENRFFVLAVTSGIVSPSRKNEILPHCHYLLENFSFRQNSGIKAGWDWIKDRDGLKHIDALAVADDSFYYSRRITSTIAQMLAQEGDWLSLFELPAQRASNGFQIFRPAVLASQAFQIFWKDYTLTANRVDLPASLRCAAFTVQTYYNAARLGGDLATALNNENVPGDLQDVLNLTLGFERHDKSSRMPVRGRDALALPAADVIAKIHALMQKTDAAYAAGLLCNYLYQAPVKRDIDRHLVLKPDDLVDLAQGFSTEEKEAMANDLQRKAAASFGGAREVSSHLSHMARSA